MPDPALHALIVGVSHYSHLPGGLGTPAPDSYGLEQLSGAAIAAAHIDDWLESAAERLAVPLGSRRVLLSPSARELNVNPGLTGTSAPELQGFREAALAWQRDCASHRDNVAFFYFAGHGVHRSQNDAALLLQDFAKDAGDPLTYSVSVRELVEGMAPTPGFEEMARTQLWFIDSCQTLPPGFDPFQPFNPTTVFRVGLPGFDDRCAPIYFSALPGAAAFAVPGEGTVFSRVLIECLEGAAAQRKGTEGWKVTVGTLLSAMQKVMVEDPRGEVQRIWGGGQVSEADRPIVALDGTPEVRVELEIHPQTDAGAVKLTVTDAAGNTVKVPNPLEPNPYSCRWPAGVYGLGAEPPHDESVPHTMYAVAPPVFPWRAEVTP